MARVAAISWFLAAVLIAGLVSYLASEEPSSCAVDPSGALLCGPQPTVETLQTVLVWTFLVPVWAPLLLLAYVMGRGPSHGLATVVAGTGILGGVVVAVVIVLVTQPSDAPSWDTPWLAFGLLIGVPGLVSALAAREIGQRRGTAAGDPATQAREPPHRWAPHSG
jgi:hypothetical protein